jgi:cytochrome P450
MNASGLSPVVLGDAFIQDRHALYERLRQDNPVCQAIMPDGLRVWLVTRYEDARAALVSPALSKSSRRASPLHDQQERDEGGQRAFPATVLESHMLNMDPPDHTRLRRLVSKAFTLRRVELLRPRIEEIVARLLDDLSAQDEVELLDAFAFPLSAAVIGELFGAPETERTHFRGLFKSIAFGTDPDAVGKAFLAMAEYLTELVARKRTHPKNDLLTALVQAHDEDDRLDEAELVSMAFLILTAGYESTGHLIGNGIVNLLNNPGQLDALRADPTLLPAVIEELLRYDGAAGTTTLRFTTAPVRLGEVEIPAGEFVVVMLGSVNRDETRFDNADQLNIGRDASGHLAFGQGAHYCLGAALARLEGEIGIGRLLERFPDMALAVEPSGLRWRNSVLFRGLETVPLTLSGS